MKNVIGGGSNDDNECSYTCGGKTDTIPCRYGGTCEDIKTSTGVVYGVECILPPGSGGGKIECYNA